MPWHQLPNLITLLRLLLIAPIVLAILSEQPALALLLFCVAGASDGVDGWLARRYQWQTRLGGYLDPIADKLLMLACVAALCLIEALPWWLMLILLLRDLIIVSGAFAYHYLIGPLQAQPTLLGKFTTVLQIALVLLVLIDLASAMDLGVLIPVAIIGVTLVSFASGMHYVAVWSTRALRSGHSSETRTRQSSEQ